MKAGKSPDTKPVTGLAGIIFDLDGTLVHSDLDFRAIRSEMGLPEGLPLLEAMAELDNDHAGFCMDVLHRHEHYAAENATLMPGIGEFLAFIDTLGLKRGILTRNCRHATKTTLERCALDFDHVLTREDGPAKPDPWGIHELCQVWGVRPEQVVMIGDYHFDLEAGLRAGSKTVLYTQGRSPEDLEYAKLAHFILEHYDHSRSLLIEMMEQE